MLLWILFSISVCIGHSEAELGKKCTHSGNCRSLSKYELMEIELCTDGICRCNPKVELRYSTSTLEPRCDEHIHSLRLLNDNCTSSACVENAECVEREVNLFSKITRKICICKEGFLRIGDDCREPNHQNVLQPCYVPESGPVYSCDIEKNSYCKNHKCICYDGYFANTTSGDCELMDTYLDAFNLTKYIVKPNEYCVKDAQCIEGLKCDDFKCSCPAPCKYDEKEEVCDCGIIEKPPPPRLTGPIIIGVLFGAMIVSFWKNMICRTIKEYKNKDVQNNGRESTALDEAPQDSHRHTAYPLNPTPAGLSAPRPSDDNSQSDFLPYKSLGGTSSPPPPPQPSFYGINPLDPINAEAPPAYTETPSSTDLPPPYSVNPPPVNSSSPLLPFPSNSAVSTGDLPYPASPSTLPYPVTPSALPYPSNPSNMPDTAHPSAASPFTPSVSAVIPSAPSFTANPHGTPKENPTQEPTVNAQQPTFNPSYP